MAVESLEQTTKTSEFKGNGEHNVPTESLKGAKLAYELIHQHRGQTRSTCASDWCPPPYLCEPLYLSVSMHNSLSLCALVQPCPTHGCRGPSHAGLRIPTDALHMFALLILGYPISIWTLVGSAIPLSDPPTIGQLAIGNIEDCLI